MENAVDALKMAFAVIVFVMALSISINMFSNARETADIVLHSSDITEYMQFQEAIEGTESRIVGMETIVPTLYKYYKENYTVIFRDASGGYMRIYTTKMQDTNLWSPDYTNKYYKAKKNIYKVCAFDVDDETKRHEPWTGSQNEYKKNIDAFLSGKKYIFPSYANTNDYGDHFYQYSFDNTLGFENKFKDNTFVENLGEYVYNGTNDKDAKKKRVIVYTLQN